MATGSDKKSGLRKPHTKITRRILVAALQEERRPLLEEVRRMVRVAVEEASQTAHSLRRDHGISLPIFSPEWDLVPTAESNPSQTIAAFDGNRSEVRVTLHLDSLVDDTTTMELEGLGISHLIGISTGGLNDSWQTAQAGGMIAVINAQVSALPALLHDVLLDMAMVHAKAQPWSGIRDQLNSHAIATLKGQFVREKDLLDDFPYGSVGECRYFPLAAFARIRSIGDAGSRPRLDLLKYVTLWSEFALFAKERAGLHKLPAERENIPAQILKSHLNAGQISPEGLRKKIAQLTPGHYCLYFLIRKAHKHAKVAELSTFFHVSKPRFRTQRWIIHARDRHAKEAAVFLSERYISIFPFYVGEK